MKRITISLEKDQYNWLKNKTDKGDFGSIGHGVRYCIQHVLDESKGNIVHLRRDNG